MAPGVNGRIILHAASAADLEGFNTEKELATILLQLLKDSIVLESRQKYNPAAALLAPLTENGAPGLLGLSHRPLVVPICM